MFSKFISKGAQFHSAAKGKYLFWQWNPTKTGLNNQNYDLNLANVKFPEGTVAGMYKAAVSARPDYDIVRVDSQKINWTLKELDVRGISIFEHLVILWITRIVSDLK